MALENNPYPQDVRVRNEAEALVADGHHVVVLAPRGPGQPRAETVNGVHVKRYRLPAGARVGGIVVEYIVALVQLTLRLLAELCRGADVIHLHNPPDLLFGVAGLTRVMDKAVIFDHHDLAPELFEQKFGSGLPAVVLRWCERMTMRVAHVVIAANESHRRVAIQRGHVDRERVVVVRNAPREDTIATAPRTREGVLRSPRLCYVGSLGSQDGVRILPKILERLCRAGLEPVLDLVGDGPELERIRSLARRHDVLDRIQFIGQVSHDQVPGIIEAADICLDVAPCTALNHQSTMIKIGEYLAAGRPIVTFALQETHYTAGDCALYAACDDLEDFCGSIMRLCADEGLRAILSAQALERAREMTWEHSTERLRHAYALASDVLTADGPANDRPAMVRSTFVSWTPHPRAEAIADALGAGVYCPSPGSRNWPAPLRYVVQSAGTAKHIIRTRPTDILFTNPPVFAGIVVVLLARAAGARAWSDSHSGAFNDPRWSRFARLNDWVMRQCAGVIVTNRPLVELVRSKGARPFVMNMVAKDRHLPQPDSGQTILAPLSYAFDEPVQELLQAAAMAPEVHMTFTGQAPDWVVKSAPENCAVVGWLSRPDYESLLSRASGVVCLTNRELTMQMGAFEALEHGIPILASGTAVLRDYLDQGGVVFADDHTPAELAAGIRALWRERERLRTEARAAQSTMFERAGQELAELRAAFDRGPTNPHLSAVR
jgi:glycosyltransferase involved in cell wall biosynthesis